MARRLISTAVPVRMFEGDKLPRHDEVAEALRKVTSDLNDMATAKHVEGWTETDEFNFSIVDSSQVEGGLSLRGFLILSRPD